MLTLIDREGERRRRKEEGSREESGNWSSSKMTGKLIKAVKRVGKLLAVLK